MLGCKPIRSGNTRQDHRLFDGSGDHTGGPDSGLSSCSLARERVAENTMLSHSSEI